MCLRALRELAALSQAELLLANDHPAPATVHTP